MKISLIAAVAENGVIGNGPDIPWSVKGEQLIFKALTYNQWLLVGRKTFESMGLLDNRKYAVISTTIKSVDSANILHFNSIELALTEMAKITDHLFIAGGAEIYRQTIQYADYLHLSTIHSLPCGNILFPKIPDNFEMLFEQSFQSNINYTYHIYKKSPIQN